MVSSSFVLLLYLRIVSCSANTSCALNSTKVRSLTVLKNQPFILTGTVAAVIIAETSASEQHKPEFYFVL
jgi:hypothetical protein